MITKRRSERAAHYSFFHPPHHVLCSISFVLEYNMDDSDDIHNTLVTKASCHAQSSETFLELSTCY